MSVLEAPQTWIAAAAVLVVIAVVLIALAPRRRAGAAASATTPVVEQGGEQGAGASEPAATTAAATAAAQADDEPVTGPVLPARAPDSAVEARAVEARADDARTEDVRVDRVRPAPAPVDDEPATDDARRYVRVPDPARADERAKDRLLAALLSDPAAAVDVVAAMPEAGRGPGASGTSAAALLRAGLSPAQVAELCGVAESDLATLVARDLGLLERSVGGRDGQRGSSRTDEPGRAWASAGSAAGSTTPTTG